MTFFHVIHFLRPMWLLAFIPVIFFLVMLRGRTHFGSAWQAVFDSHLLPYFLSGDSSRKNKSYYWMLAGFWSLIVVALSGPSWHQRPQPVYRNLAATVIVLDLSRSMDAADVVPSRLSRAKFKVLDLLKQLENSRVGLVVFAGEPYIVSPLTEDTKTISAMVPALQTDIMPAPGQDVAFALKKAGSLLERGGAVSGNIILLSDSVPGKKALSVARELQKKNIHIQVLGVGTQAGAPIKTHQGFLQDDQGNILVAKLNAAALKALASEGGGHYIAFTNSSRDIRQLATFSTRLQPLNNLKKGKQHVTLWEDQGYWFLLFAVLLALGFFRGEGFLSWTN